MASKILANLLIAGGAVLVRAATQAYRQAIINGTRAGMTAEGAKAAAAAKQMSLKEAEMILGVESSSSWEEVMERYKRMFEANQAHGSFYLQSKVYRAKERLEQEFQESGRPMPGGSDGGEQQQHSEERR